jgi:hypothetical protein
MPQSWDMGHIFYFPSEGQHTEDFLDARKIQRLRPGLNPRTRVPVASMLTTRAPKPSKATKEICGTSEEIFSVWQTNKQFNKTKTLLPACDICFL